MSIGIIVHIILQVILLVGQWDRWMFRSKNLEMLSGREVQRSRVTDVIELDSLFGKIFQSGNIMDNFKMSLVWHCYLEELLIRNKLYRLGGLVRGAHRVTKPF